MSYPFKIDGPTCISFSGGRTSAYMLWLVLQSNGGLPDEAVVVFTNTGREAEVTLAFVAEVSRRWSVPIRWAEYRRGFTFAEVDFASASRAGEPFEALIRDKGLYLPNPVERFCTAELKIKTAERMLRAEGWTEWDSMLGMRADEPLRVAKIRAAPILSDSPGVGRSASKNYRGNFKSPIFVRTLVYFCSLLACMLLCAIGLKHLNDKRKSLGASLIGAGVFCGLAGTCLFLATLWRASWGWWL